MYKKSTVLALIAALTAVLGWLATKSAAQPAPFWQFPLLPTPAITRGFSPPVHDWLPGHRGVDLRAQAGQIVRAPANGIVTFAGDLAGRGVVVLKHGPLRSTYEPVASDLVVGDFVTRGDQIGWLKCGASHCCTGSRVNCLHWGLLRGKQYLNPLSKVDFHVRLLPIDPLLPRVTIPRVTREKSSLNSTNQISRLEDEPDQRQHANDPLKRAYKVAWLPNWHGPRFLALL